MRLIKQILAVGIIATAVAAWVLWVVTPLIHDGADDYPFWQILNFFMAASVLVVLVNNAAAKWTFDRAHPGDTTISREWLVVNLLFFASLVLAAWFYWNWFYYFVPENEPGAADIHLEMWTLINPLFYLVCGATGFRMFRGS